MMKTSITGIESASWYTPLVLRGAYTDMIRQAAQLGYDGIELHLMDSDAVDKKAIITALKENHVELTSIGTGPSYNPADDWTYTLRIRDRGGCNHRSDERAEKRLRRSGKV